MSATTYVGTRTSGYSTNTQSTTVNVTPTAGNDLVLRLLTFTSGAALSATGVTTNGGGKIIPDVPFSVNGTYGIGFGVYRIHGAAAVAQNIVANFSGNVECFAWIDELNNVGMFDTSQPAVLSGSTNPFENASFVPSQNGACVITWGSVNGASTIGTWGDGFTATGGSRTGGPTALAAYLDQVTAAATQATNTLGTVHNWSALAVSYVPVNTAPTITSVGTIQEGATGIPVVGTNFGTGMVLAATQPNGISVDQSSVTVQSGSITSANVTAQPSGTLAPGYYYNIALTDQTGVGAAAIATAVVAQDQAPTNGALTATAGGALAAETYYVRSTWVTAAGETLGGGETSLAVAASNVLNVAAPANAPTDATGWNVYVSTATGTETKQNTTAIALGTAWVEPTTGLISGAALPSTNTTTAVVRSVTFSDPGYDYAVNDVLLIPSTAITGATSATQITVTAINSTSRATFNAVVEPATGDQLAYTDSTFVTNLTATVGSLSSAPFPVTVAPPTTGIPFQTLGSLNPTAPNRITAEPDLVTGDQLEFAGNSSGTTAPAAGTVIHSDGTFEATQPFWVRAYITADFAWTGWVQQVTTGLDPSQGFFGGGM